MILFLNRSNNIASKYIFDSVEKRVLQSLLVPVTILVKDEGFTALSVFEAKIWVEHVDFPHEWSVNLGAVNFFEASNINDVALHFSEQSSLVEHDLLGVRQ